MFTKKRAFTLVELIMTLTIFAIVAVICVSSLINSLSAARKIQAQAFLYSESQAVMDQLAREVEQNTIDYSAYYERNVQGEMGWETPDYGFYAQSFYYPGDSDPSTLGGPYTGIDGYKALCDDGINYYPESCPTETPNYDYLDLNTGAHPFTYIDDFSGYYDVPSYMNAFCESANGSVDCNTWENATKNDLILINGAGDRRTVFAKEAFGSVSGEYQLSKVELSGSDTDEDGIVDTWECTDRYSCNDTYSNEAGTYSIPDYSDLTSVEDPAEDFMPITPKQLNVEEIYFIIAPMEDPYLAFAEEDVQIQPQVTIVMKVTLSQDYAGNLLGELPSIVVQRTVSTGVYSAVESYE